jgi:type I restriction enzyme, S subunit
MALSQFIKSLVNTIRFNSSDFKASDLKSIFVLLPPLDEQRSVAAFLSRETAKIDTLIAKQERLIELLQEKRQALISHAVTKGLNPDAPMKDSGIEWLGEIPAHWEVKRLKFTALELKAGPFGSSLTKDNYVPSGYKVYGQEQVIPADFEIGDYYI